MTPPADDVVHSPDGRRRRRPFPPSLRRLLLAVGLAATAVCTAPAGASAQNAPADTAAVLLDLAEQLEAEGRFAQARLLYELIRERYPTVAAAATAERRLAAIAPMREPRSGRTELLVWSTLYGLWLGVAVPAALGADDAEIFGLGLIAGAPAGLLTARSYARDREVTEGHARAITLGGTWGTWQGFGWREVFDIGDDQFEACPDFGDCYSYESDSETAPFIAAVVGGLAGIATGTAIANSRDVRAGTATTVNFGALWGTWYGVVLGVLADLEDDALLASALLGGDAGLVGTALKAPEWNMSVERARLISIAGVGGGVIGAGIDLLVQPSDEKVAILIPAITSTLGLILGVGWTDDREEDSGEGRGEPGRGDASRPDALLDVRDGEWRWGTPLPQPTLLRAAPERVSLTGRRWEPGLRFELVRARF